MGNCQTQDAEALIRWARTAESKQCRRGGQRVKFGERELRTIRRYLPAKLPRGQSLVEFALVLPLILIVVLGTIDFGRVVFSWIEVMNASREGAAYAIINPSDLGGITLHVQQETNVQQQRGESPLSVDVTCRPSDNNQLVLPCNAAYANGLGSTVTVRVEESFSFLTPLINGMFPDFTISAAATGFYMSPLGGGPTPTPTASPSPTPSPTPTPEPGATATPTPISTASPTPVPTGLCTVPNFVGQLGNDAPGLWTAASFVPANLTNHVPGNSTIRGQSLGAGTSQVCATAQIILN